MRTPCNSIANAGLSHPDVRRFLDVKRGRGPRSDTEFALEGLWALRAATAACVRVEAAFVCPELLRGDEAGEMLGHLRAEGTRLLQVSARVLCRMVQRDGPDGLAALAHRRPAGFPDVTVGRDTRIVVADRFDLVGNLGALIRCADGAGAAGVIVVDCPFRLGHPLLMKASMGTVLSMPVVTSGREEAISWLRSHGFRIVAADPSAPIPYVGAEYGPPVAIVLGSERLGLSPAWVAEADVTVSIPMLGIADSLNVGHAAALLLYEALRQLPS